MIEEGGTVKSRYYRKPQKKDITLHQNSHHPGPTKVATIRNFYRTAEIMSTGPQEAEYSRVMIDKLLNKNGYMNPRNHLHTRSTRTRNVNRTNKKHLTILKIAYISEYTSNRIRNTIKTSGLPIRPIFIPGRKLKDVFVRSRPYDQPICILGNQENCPICPLITGGNTCAIMNILYHIMCLLCEECYGGETMRVSHDRFSEHLRAANNPSKYPTNAIGQHYAEYHPGSKAQLSFKIVKRFRDTARRKISESLYIIRQGTRINKREEMGHIRNTLSGLF